MKSMSSPFLENDAHVKLINEKLRFHDCTDKRLPPRSSLIKQAFVMSPNESFEAMVCSVHKFLVHLIIVLKHHFVVLLMPFKDLLILF